MRLHRPEVSDISACSYGRGQSEGTFVFYHDSGMTITAISRLLLTDHRLGFPLARQGPQESRRRVHCH